MKRIALNIIGKAFAGKKDKAGRPYTEHLFRVAENAKQYFEGNEYHEDLYIIALLHDLLEDCPEWTETHINAIFQNVAITSSVLILTKKEGLSYDEYIKNISGNRMARAVKLADLKDNMDLTRLSELTEKDIDRIKKYHKSYNTLLGKRH